MPRETFDRALKIQLDQVLILGSMSEHAIQQAMDALQRHDYNASRKIYEADIFINEKRYTIEQGCITLIATQQPMARDVRLLAAILEIITELERIGDYAKGICKINLLLTDSDGDPSIYYELRCMSELGLGMLRRALDAFLAGDSTAARAIANEDDRVDQLYNQIYDQLIKAMIADKTSIDHANHLMWAAHNLERMADRVTNICERIVYSVTGEMKELDVPTGLPENNG